MKARLILERKRVFDDGAILQLRLWEVAESVPGSVHRLKYSLYYGRLGVRLVSYDNERGKGDHRHYRDWEEPYLFRSVRDLISDFLLDVSKFRGGAPS